MKNRFLSIVLMCCGISAPLHSQSDPVQEQPNILVFMADQMIPMFSGPYGSEAAITPNLDKLAAEGVVFENAYSTCPVCVPARYSLLTGMYLVTHQA